MPGGTARGVDARLLGDVAGLDVLEVGCGAAQGARWLTAAGARVTAFDVSLGQLQQARELDERTGVAVARLVQADAQHLPFASGSFDLAVSAFGALPFVADAPGTLRRGRSGAAAGRAAGLQRHPPAALGVPGRPRPGRADGRPVVLRPDAVRRGGRGGPAVYVEHHRTLGDWVRASSAPGFALDDLIEPEWPAGRTEEWGQWSPLRGALVPGTAIFSCHLA